MLAQCGDGRRSTWLIDIVDRIHLREPGGVLVGHGDHRARIVAFGKAVLALLLPTLGGRAQLRRRATFCVMVRLLMPERLARFVTQILQLFRT